MIALVAGSFFGLDANEWQAIFAGVAAVGTVVAAVVAFIALRYFKSQTEAMQDANKVTREQLQADESRRRFDLWNERRREHEAVRPALVIRFGARALPANEVEATIQLTGGKAVRYAEVEAILENRDVAGEVEPSRWPEIVAGGYVTFRIRASGMSQGDRLAVRMTYVDALDWMIKWTQPLVVTQTNPVLALTYDPERPPTVNDDPSDRTVVMVVPP